MTLVGHRGDGQRRTPTCFRRISLRAAEQSDTQDCSGDHGGERAMHHWTNASARRRIDDRRSTGHSTAWFPSIHLRETSIPQVNAPLVGVGQISLDVERCAAAAGGRCDRLPVGAVDEITAGEHPGEVRARRAPLRLHVSSLVEVDLPARRYVGRVRSR